MATNMFYMHMLLRTPDASQWLYMFTCTIFSLDIPFFPFHRLELAFSSLQLAKVYSLLFSLAA